MNGPREEKKTKSNKSELEDWSTTNLASQIDRQNPPDITPLLLLSSNERPREKKC